MESGSGTMKASKPMSCNDLQVLSVASVTSVTRVSRLSPLRARARLRSNAEAMVTAVTPLVSIGAALTSVACPDTVHHALGQIIDSSLTSQNRCSVRALSGVGT